MKSMVPVILCIHTVFILRENILFIEEWLRYHIALGFDRFYLYDNSGSEGYDGSTGEINKYNINFREITAHLSDADIAAIFSRIREQYASYIVYIRWQPRDEHGRIMYGQRDSIIHYLTHHAAMDAWTAFIDMDEFIYTSFSLKTLIDEYQQKAVNGLVITQKKFKDRFESLPSNVTDIVDCIEGIDTKYWAPKQIIKNSSFDVSCPFSDWSIHDLPSAGYKVLVNRHKLRFNHYNVNQHQLHWMQQQQKKDTPLSFNSTCYELKMLWNSKNGSNPD